MYHRYADLEALMQQLAQQYPDITRLYDIGSSVQGRVPTSVLVAMQR